MIIRREEKEDIRVVEELIRDAFWNVYGPGGNGALCGAPAEIP